MCQQCAAAFKIMLHKTISIMFVDVGAKVLFFCKCYFFESIFVTIFSEWNLTKFFIPPVNKFHWKFSSFHYYTFAVHRLVCLPRSGPWCPVWGGRDSRHRCCIGTFLARTFLFRALNDQWARFWRPHFYMYFPTGIPRRAWFSHPGVFGFFFCQRFIRSHLPIIFVLCVNAMKIAMPSVCSNILMHWSSSFRFYLTACVISQINCIFTRNASGAF